MPLGEALRRLSIRLASGVITLVISLASAASQTALQYESLDIEGPNTLQLAPDPRFDAPDQGTVELVLAIAPQQQQLPVTEDRDDSSLCIAEHGSGTALDWQLKLWMSGKTDVLRFGRPDGGHVEVMMPLRGTGYHHVLFATAGGRTQAIVDGKLIGERSTDGVTPQPGVPFTYLPGVPDGRPLTFGCSKGPTAKVWISTFRLWDVALGPEDAADLMKYRGPIGEPTDLANHLLAFSLFTNRQKEMRFTGDRIRFTEFAGAPGGKPFFYKRPRGQELYAVYFKSGAGTRLADFTAEFDAPIRFGPLSDGQNWSDLSLPSVLPRRTNAEAGERAGWVMRRIAALARFGPAIAAGSGAAEDFALMRPLLLRYREAERTRAFGAQGSRMIGTNDYAEGEFYAYAAPLASYYRYHDVIASYGSDGIKAMQWGTDGLARSQFKGFVEGRQDVFGLEVPDGGRLEGIAGRMSGDGALLALSLAYSMGETGDPARSLARRITEGVWVDEASATPVRQPMLRKGDEASTFDGTYGDQKVYRFTSDHGGTQLILHIDEAKGLGASTMAGTGGAMRLTFDPLRGNEWQDPDQTRPGFERLWVGEDRIRWGGKDDLDGGGIILVRPEPYPEPDENKLPWGATFSLDHRPNGVVASFNGYNPAKMRARDYQATTGADKMLFRMPADTSTDYTTTGSRVIVPNGFFFSLDSRGSERADTIKIDSSQERQNSWTIGLGGKAGIPLLASFQVDGSHQESQETVNDAGLSMVQNRSIVTHYAFVLDRSRVQLTDAFRAAIVELRNRNVADFPLDWDAFFDEFGTYYPYAVTYGGMAWSETTTCSNDTSLTTSSTDSISFSGSGILDEMLEVGVSANSEHSSGSKSASGSARERTNFGTYGGSFSKGGGWSVARGEELPVLLDLRPIYELVSPIFFDDPRVHQDLRKAMEAAFKAHYDALAKPTGLRWSTDEKPEPPDIAQVCNQPPPEPQCTLADPCVVGTDDPIEP